MTRYASKDSNMSLARPTLKKAWLTAEPPKSGDLRGSL
jgi:hypothetical protein